MRLEIKSTVTYGCLDFDLLFPRLEPGSAPRNIQVRLLSSSTMVIQWEEPETPNGQVIVSTPNVKLPIQ